MSKEEEEKNISNEGGEIKEQEFPTTVSRGFSGAPKFSEFRRTATATKTSANSGNATSSSGTKDNKDTKPMTKSRGLGEIDDGDDEEMSMVDEENDSHGLLENILEQLSVVKQEVKEFTHHIAHEVNEIYQRSIKGDDHDP